VTSKVPFVLAGCALLIAAALANAGSSRGEPTGAGISTSYRDRPPLAHTGGFGEPTCAACHAGTALNGGGGTVEIRGLPKHYRGDSSYTIVVTIVQTEMIYAGFELSLRDSLGKRLGKLSTSNPAVLVSSSEAGVQYAYHSRLGTTHLYPDTARWAVTWTAPDDPSGPAVLNVAINAANGDNSEFGDAIYVVERVALPARTHK